jgi:hypothetical protein
MVYPELAFNGFLQSLKENAKIAPYARLPLLTTPHFTNHFTLRQHRVWATLRLLSLHVRPSFRSDYFPRALFIKILYDYPISPNQAVWPYHYYVTFSTLCLILVLQCNCLRSNFSSHTWNAHVLKIDFPNIHFNCIHVCMFWSPMCPPISIKSFMSFVFFSIPSLADVVDLITLAILN